jgi:hypothetical protein
VVVLGVEAPAASGRPTPRREAKRSRSTISPQLQPSPLEFAGYPPKTEVTTPFLTTRSTRLGISSKLIA